MKHFGDPQAFGQRPISSLRQVGLFLQSLKDLCFLLTFIFLTIFYINSWHEELLKCADAITIRTAKE